MSTRNKINGYPLKEFEQLDFNIRTLYRYVDSYKSNKSINEALINHKYGSEGTIDEKLYKYYLPKLFNIKFKPLHVRKEKLGSLQTEIFLAVDLLNLNSNLVEDVWENLMIYYLN